MKCPPRRAGSEFGRCIFPGYRVRRMSDGSHNQSASPVHQGEARPAPKSCLHCETLVTAKATVNPFQYLLPSRDCRALRIRRVHHTRCCVSVKQDSAVFQIDPFGERRFARSVWTRDQREYWHRLFKQPEGLIRESLRSYFRMGRLESNESQIFARPAAPLRSSPCDPGRTQVVQRQG